MKKLILPVMMLLAGAPAFAQSTTAATNGAPTAAQRQQFAAQMQANLASKLSLTPDESSRLQATFTKYRSQMQPVHQQMRTVAQQIEQELAKPAPDQGRLTQLTDQLVQARQQLRTIEDARTAELKGQLTPQQFAQLALMKLRHHGRGGHYGHRGGFGGDAQQ